MRIKSIIAILGCAALLTACEKIDTGNVGIESLWGQVKREVLIPGVYQTFTKTIYEVNAKEIGISFNDMKPRTAGNLFLEDLDVDIYYQINGSKAADIMIKYSGDLTKDNNGDYMVGHNFVVRSAREAIYSATAKFDAANLHQKRQEFSDSIRELLQNSVDHDMGKDWVKVTTVNIRNLVTDSSMEASIRKIAQQELERKEAVESQKTLVETNKRLMLQAQGEANQAAERKIIEARNQAQVAIEQARGQAIANKLISESLTPEILKIREIEMTGKFADKGSTTFFMPTNQTVTPLLNMSK